MSDVHYNPRIRGNISPFLAFAAIVFAVFSLSSCLRPDAAEQGPGRHSEELSKSTADSGPAPELKPNAEVVGINDGDTITVRMYETGEQKRLRLATIDAPEMNQPFGRASKQSLSDLAFRQHVAVVENGRDRYGRTVAEVYVKNLNLNVEQIRRGFAWHYKKHENEQTAEQRQIYAMAEEVARQNRFGLWRDANAVPPWEFRRPKNGAR